MQRRRTGDDWFSRRVARSGVISVAWQPFSVGKHHGGEMSTCTTDRLLEVWSGNELIKTLLRASEARSARSGRRGEPPVPLS